MVNFRAIHSVGESLITLLDNSYPSELSEAHPCQFRLLSSGELAGMDDSTCLSLYLYRVTFNEHLRNASRVNGFEDRKTPLAVDLHYLMTIWANSALAEHTILAWAMQQMHQNPVLDGSSLSPEPGWGADDVIQLIPAELSNEDIMRIWDAVDPPYRLSVSYIARVIRIDSELFEEQRPVVGTRFTYMTGKERP